MSKTKEPRDEGEFKPWTPEAFAYNLGEILIELGMTQAEFSKRTRLTPAAVSQILNGDREPSLSSILKIMRVLPVSFERFMK